MPNPDSFPLQAIVVDPGWVRTLQDDAAVLKAAARTERDRDPRGCVLLVPSPVQRLEIASAILQAAGCRWSTTLLGPCGKDVAVWLVGVSGDAVRVEAAFGERLARAAVDGSAAIVEALDAEPGFEAVVVRLDATS